MPTTSTTACAGLLDLDRLREVPLVGAVVRDVEARHPGLERPRFKQEVIRRIITRMVEDVIAATLARLEDHLPGSSDDVRNAGRALVAFSPEVAAADHAIKTFLFRTVYRSEAVMVKMRAAETVVEALFAAYMAAPAELPPEWRRGLDIADRARLARRVCDYVAGMTDRFALGEHHRLVGPTPDLDRTGDREVPPPL